MDLAVIFVCAVISVAIGTAIGSARGNAGAGFVLSLVLGPVGWLIVLCLSDNRFHCSACKGAIPQGASRCLHCGIELELRLDPKIIPMIHHVDTRVPVDCPVCSRTSYVQPADKSSGLVCPGCNIGFVPTARKFKL